jgi:poly(A) polymerase
MTTPEAGAAPPSLRDAPWLARPETQAVLLALEGGGYEARIVGGAVRNALIDAAVKDLDIATTALPQDVIRLAKAAGLQAIPTGIEHGTVTIVADRVQFEVTTLRRDVETFGRHATVAFTDDWAEDARRRDFTINALYCDREGTVHDPLGGGYEDLRARRVQFIGDAHERIREDYLRILRFFRFTATYAKGDPDAQGLAASLELRAGLAQLSGERIRTEMMRLLEAPRAVEIISVMARAGLINDVLGCAGDADLLARLAAIEAALDLPPDALLRLAALADTRPGLALALRERLKLSNAEFERLARAAMPDRGFDPAEPEREAKAFIYRHDAETFRDGALLAWARSGAAPDDPARRERYLLPTRWHAPELPVRGSNVIEAGIAEGPAVGRIVRAFEDWWIAEGFPTDTEKLARALHRFVKTSGH